MCARPKQNRETVAVSGFVVLSKPRSELRRPHRVKHAVPQRLVIANVSPLLSVIRGVDDDATEAAALEPVGDDISLI
jgi:hypothetical protein